MALSFSSASSSSAIISSSTGTTITSLIKSVGSASLFDGKGVNQENKKLIDNKTIESLATCDSYETDFIFWKIQFYARPIQGIGDHNTNNDDGSNNNNNEQKINKNNAYKASKGYHHGLLILTFGAPKPIHYVLDRVEGVRFIQVNLIESELQHGHLLLIKEYNNINIPYSRIKPFIQNESKKIYNVVNNNCLNFVYKFIDEIIKKNEWNDFNSFWKFISTSFNVTDIQCGKYNKQQNDYIKAINDKKVLLQQKIKLINDKQTRNEWKKNDQVLIKLDHFKSAKSWIVGKICDIDDGETNYIWVQYIELGETKETMINDMKLRL